MLPLLLVTEGSPTSPPTGSTLVHSGSTAFLGARNNWRALDSTPFVHLFCNYLATVAPLRTVRVQRRGRQSSGLLEFSYCWQRTRRNVDQVQVCVWRKMELEAGESCWSNILPKPVFPASSLVQSWQHAARPLPLTSRLGRRALKVKATQSHMVWFCCFLFWFFFL